MRVHCAVLLDRAAVTEWQVDVRRARASRLARARAPLSLRPSTLSGLSGRHAAGLSFPPPLSPLRAPIGIAALSPPNSWSRWLPSLPALLLLLSRGRNRGWLLIRGGKYGGFRSKKNRVTLLHGGPAHAIQNAEPPSAARAGPQLVRRPVRCRSSRPPGAGVYWREHRACVHCGRVLCGLVRSLPSLRAHVAGPRSRGMRGVADDAGRCCRLCC